MINFKKNEIKTLVTAHFPAAEFKIVDMTGEERGSNGYPVTIEKMKGEKFFLKIVKKDKASQQDIDFEIATLKELAETNNSNLVKLLEAIDAGNGFIILKFEFIPGKTLEELIQEKISSKSYFFEDEIYQLGRNILNALKSIDVIGKVHHDIKPKNIKYDGKKYILLDLGISRFKEPIVSRRSKVIYKYSSPEQLLSGMGITPRPTISIQSDLFSVGILMYEMATLKYPFGNGDYNKIINSVVGIAPNKINNTISDDLANIIMRLLRRRISERFLNLDDLEKCLNEKSCHTRKHRFEKSVFYLQYHSSSTRFANFLDYKTVSPRIAPKGIVFSTSFFPQDDKRISALVTQEYKFLIEPETYLLPFKSKSHKNQLKYAKYNLKTNDYFSELITKKKIDSWVNEVIAHQLSKGSDFIITPTFLIRNSTDKNFNLNLNIIQKTITACQNRGLSQPIVCHYVVRKDFICDDQSRDFLISQIVALDDVYAVLLTAESDVHLGREPKCDASLLSAIKDFAEKVGQRFPVILNYGGTESIPLFAYGLSGVVTNMYKTNFRTDVLHDLLDSGSGGGRSKPYYYVPGMMNFLEIREIDVLLRSVEGQRQLNKISTQEARQITSAFVCDCPFCNRAGVFDGETKIPAILDKIEAWGESDLDNHFLYHVTNESRKIWSMEDAEAKKYIARRIKFSKDLYQLISVKLAIRLKKASSGSFLIAWEKVFI